MNCSNNCPHLLEGNCRQAVKVADGYKIKMRYNCPMFIDGLEKCKNLKKKRIKLRKGGRYIVF